MLETFRLSNEATSIRYVARPVTIEDGGYNHQLKAGTWVSIPHGVIQKDPTIFPDPHKFIPGRFLETDAETGRIVARYGRLRPWGMGPGMCKGRTFAEKEILTIAAAIASLWDIVPASGTWKIPAMRPGTGVMCPVEDIRVIIRRRALTSMPIQSYGQPYPPAGDSRVFALHRFAASTSKRFTFFWELLA